MAVLPVVPNGRGEQWSMRFELSPVDGISAVADFVC
jgi:hypothetical protein